MGWIPEWAAKSYAKLFVEFQDKSFDVSTGLKVLKFTDQEFSRLIQELQAEGFLYKERKAIDRRMRQYTLVSPEHAVYALSLAANQNVSLDEKLRTARGHFNYLITGGSAASRYHNYVHYSKMIIRVFRKDLGFWIAYLTEPGFRVSIDGQVSERGKVIVDLVTDLIQGNLARAHIQDGIYIEAEEDLIESLLRKPTDDNVLDVLAMMIKSREVLDWNSLINSNLYQEIGFLMEASNYTAGGNIFPDDLVNLFRREFPQHKRFGSSTPTSRLDQSYAELANRWGLELGLHPRIITKVIDDLT